jgi:outer membrane murein-binding lipoprotein Lpp
MLKPMILSLAAAMLCGTAAAGCTDDEAALRASAGEAQALGSKIEAHRELLSAASANVEKATSDLEAANLEAELGRVETELDDLKAARGSALYDIFDLRPQYQKSCKTPAQPILDEFGITAEDLDLD